MVRDQRLTARELAVLVRNAYVIDVLSQINEWLRGTLADQRKSLGQLRRKVNRLERELLRARRVQTKGLCEEVEAATSHLPAYHLASPPPLLMARLREKVTSRKCLPKFQRR